MNVLLVCQAGMSTSLLVTNMRKVAEPGDTIEAVSFGELAEHLSGFDVVLLGPQIRFRLADVTAAAAPQGKPVGVIDMRAYGMMDGAVAMAQARSLLAS